MAENEATAIGAVEVLAEIIMDYACNQQDAEETVLIPDEAA